MQDYTGHQIDRYQVISRLGVGGMAVVYKAYDVRLERDVALKLIRTEAIPAEQHERLLKRFEREAKAQAKFSHPNIVPIYDYGEIDGTPYLVMEYVPNGTLKERLTLPQDYRQAITWVLPIADALRYAHERNTVHRDVKPSNILFDEEDRLLLTDFGIAKILETDEATLTGTGMGVGTPEYMAPEQWKGQACEASDQYALGVVLYEMLTGQKPFTAETPVAVALKQMTEPIPCPSDLVSGIPEAVEKILYKLLAQSPSDRYENMGICHQALSSILSNENQTPEQIVDKEDSPTDKAQNFPDPPKSISEAETYDLVEEAKSEPKGEHIVEVVRTSGVSQIEHESSFEQSPKSQVIREEHLTIGSTRVNPVDGAEMVYVPAGEFSMGETSFFSFVDEGPIHNVHLDAYWIYKYPVTNQQFLTFLKSKKLKTNDMLPWYFITSKYSRITEGNYSTLIEQGYSEHPVVNVSWFGAKAYCEWAGANLPTEAQWEKAARGTTKQKYPWGNEKPNLKLANYGEIIKDTTPVGKYIDNKSPYGVFDLAGNVWEWVADWFSSDYYRNSPYRNPIGPTFRGTRVIRGGSFYCGSNKLRVTYRGQADPNYQTNDCGFRCVFNI